MMPIAVAVVYTACGLTFVWAIALLTGLLDDR